MVQHLCTACVGTVSILLRPGRWCPEALQCSCEDIGQGQDRDGCTAGSGTAGRGPGGS